MSANRPDPLYFLDAARSSDQRRYMEELEADSICIFCEEHVEEYQAEPVELRGEHWFVTRNSYPYSGTAAHYLIVARRHVRSFDDLPDEAGAELWSIKRTLKRRLDPVATATIERSGEMRFNGGSVAHLHVHFVALDPSPEETVRFKVSAEGSRDQA
jgi:diadenosine tetraphosphate (Ap4A) HIT family hydrolase